MSIEPAGGAEHTGSALRRCISVDAVAFAKECWDQRPLFSPAAAADGYDDLFSRAAAEELITRRGLRTPFIRMAKQGSVLNAQTFTRSGGIGATIADQVADDKVVTQLADGSTLVLQGLHRTWPPLIDFANVLADELGHPVQINAYITPPHSQGFAAHYDTHDVFVLQIAGPKHWTIHEPILKHPLPDQSWEKYRSQVSARAGESPLLDLTLNPGDALYLPRGYLHSAAAEHDLSIHLTVGIHPVTAHSLLREVLAMAADDEQLRASLPMAADLADLTVLAPFAQSSLERLAKRLAEVEVDDLRRIADRVGSELRRDTRPAPLSVFDQTEVISELTPRTAVQRRPHLHVTLHSHDSEVLLRYLDRELSFDQAAETALEQLLSGSVLTPAELGGLDAVAQLELVRVLLSNAVLVPVRA